MTTSPDALEGLAPPSDVLNRWRLTYAASAGPVDFPFGDYASGYPLTEQPTMGRGDLRSQDMASPAGDGVGFGVDYWSGDTYGFTLAVVPGSVDPATATWWRPGLDMHATFARVWNAEPVRTVPGAVAELHHDGRGRLAYGRPRAIAPAWDRLRKGWSAIAADFVTVDPYWYAQIPNEVTLGVVPASTGGLVAPLVSPLTSQRTPEGEPRPGYVTGAGDTPAPTVVTFTGPSRNPTVTVLDEVGGTAWTLKLARALAYDETATIDTRHWRRTAYVTRGDGAIVPAAGALRGSALADCRVPAPGTFAVVYTAEDPGGTSRATVWWRDTFNAR